MKAWFGLRMQNKVFVFPRLPTFKIIFKHYKIINEMTDLIFWMFVDLSESQICRLRLIRTYLVMTWLEGLKGNLWMCVDLNRKGRISLYPRWWSNYTLFVDSVAWILVFILFSGCFRIQSKNIYYLKKIKINKDPISSVVWGWKNYRFEQNEKM